MKPHSLYIEFDRNDWSALRDHTPLPMTEAELEHLKGLNEQVSIQEVEQMYLPLTRLIHLYVEASRRLHLASTAFHGKQTQKVPYIIGIAGSVAVGKSTTSRLLQSLLSRWDGHRNVDLVTTDGFLYPNRVLEERGMMNKKGFPESYDIKKLLKFIATVKSGAAEAHAPVYSHLYYDILQDEVQVVRNPDILILEGINVLQVNKEAQIFVSDFFDFSIFVDAQERDIEQWYIERFLMLRDTAFRNPTSYFHKYGSLTKEEAVQTATRIWKEINSRNLSENILPTKGRAQLILRKDADHSIRNIYLRKL
ncbi:type I pantothenate kinase [Paenibacillus thalictri]|uniref:Pantothenate kinase n=1 Tax=Paenibacillus thalictri TaxID=2527873 RepID=A0A4Q9DZG4_9BACL|nr:type I pantothenate kinase [Paenibacillus thalictri]TBL81318.1 type I pantothenate kinase [Paenibacillus thalictri]